MASFYFDGNKLRIYEVPTNSTYTVDGQGYRIYTPVGQGEAVVRFDVQRDLWSRFQDYVALNSWSTIAFNRSGGNFRGYDENNNAVYQTNDFNLVSSYGWRIVLADYPHEVILRGNLFSDDGSGLFDYSRLTAQGVVPRIEGYDSLQTYTIASGGGGVTAAQVWSYSDRTLSASGISSIVSAVVTGLSTAFTSVLNAISGKASQSSVDAVAVNVQDIKDLSGYTDGNPMTANPTSGTITTLNGKRVIRTESGSNATYTRDDA